MLTVRPWEPPPSPPPPVLTGQGGGYIAAVRAARLEAEKHHPLRPPRPAQQCTVGAGYYPATRQTVPTLRLRGRWLEQLGFTIGSTLRITVRDGALVIAVEAPA